MENLVGKKFGLLTILSKGSRSSYYLCKCECGVEKEVYITSLKNGNTKSCGCLKIQKLKNRVTTHGMSKTRIYSIWANMLTRATNKNNDYQKKDIKISISEEWLDFSNFKNDMFESYIEHISKYGKVNTTIDRINNNDGYRKENCRWATMATQRKNQGRRCDQRKIKATNIDSGESIIFFNQRSFARKIKGNIAGIYWALKNDRPYKGWIFKRLEESYYENKENRKERWEL